jgi:hypothetical protein
MQGPNKSHTSCMEKLSLMPTCHAEGSLTSQAFALSTRPRFASVLFPGCQHETRCHGWSSNGCT